MELGKTPTIHFNIFIDVKYCHVKVVGNETTFWMSTIGFSKSIKKFDILSIEKKLGMLGQIMCQPTLLCSLNFKFGYFCMQLFFLSGGALNSTMLILMNFIWFHYLLVWFNFFVKVSPRAGVLTSSVFYWLA